jgi:RHS repeat-associated protein
MGQAFSQEPAAKLSHGVNWRTNNGSAAAFLVDGKNQLTNAAGTFMWYDANGNQVSRWDGFYHTYGYAYTYDDENRLTRIEDTTNHTFRTDFVYDGLGRLRKRLEYGSGGSSSSLPGGIPGLADGQDSLSLQLATSWQLSSETRYIYDGNRVIQERDGNNNPLVAYTRGNDLSQSLEGAGGIGGLLARSHGYSGGNWSTHYFYHADGNGNVTYLVNSSQGLAASYRYDPFGNTLSKSGGVADANVYRFSSKEIHVNSGIYYYLYRFYDPSLQRWMNRDPIKEEGGINLYGFVLNSPVDFYDADGLSIFRDIGKKLAGPGILCTDKSCDKDKCKDKAKRLPEEGWEDDVKKKKDPWRDIPDPGKCADADAVVTSKGILKIPNGVTCTIRCDNDGKPKDIICKKRWRYAPDPQMNPPNFPKSPFPK